MHQIHLPAGTNVLLGSPATPMPREMSAAVAGLVASVPGILEAHLRQCFAVGVMDAPAQILVLSVPPDADVETMVNSIVRGLSRIIPAGEHLDILPMSPSDPMLSSVRDAHCQIFTAMQPRPWWKFW